MELSYLVCPLKVDSLVRKSLLVLLVLTTSAYAEEGGSGHYMPGSMASFVDGVPSEPAFVARLNVVAYDGSVDAGRTLPIAGVVAADVDAKSTAIGATFLWAPDWDLGERWTFAMSATIPVVSIEVSATAVDGPVTGAITDKETGLGDIVFIPLMLNYRFNPDFNMNVRITMYLPTGDYEVGRLANTGKNFFTWEPTIGFVYFGQKNGFEASLYAGVDINRENSDTNYTSGKQAHLDGTLAQHFPGMGGLLGLGLSGYVYRQVSADEGEGAVFGDFKAHANGLGPVASWSGAWGSTDVSAELKWLHEFGNKNRLEGDTIWFKLLGKF